MNNFLLFLAVVLVSSVAGDSAFPKNSSSVKKDLSFIERKNIREKVVSDCLKSTELSTEDLKALKDKAATEALTGKEEKFICCAFQSLIKNEKLNTVRLERVLESTYKDLDLDIGELEGECEKNTGISANKLKSCPDTAKFIQCFFAKARKLATEKLEKPEKLDKEDKEEKQDKEKPFIYLDENTDSGIKTTKTVKDANGRVVITKKT